MGKKRKLAKLLRKRGHEDARALVICVGKKCCPRAASRRVVEAARAHAAAHHPDLRIEVAGCLHVCKKGPIAATYPEVRFKRRVGPKRARKLVDKLARR